MVWFAAAAPRSRRRTRTHTTTVKMKPSEIERGKCSNSLINVPLCDIDTCICVKNDDSVGLISYLRRIEWGVHSKRRGNFVRLCGKNGPLYTMLYYCQPLHFAIFLFLCNTVCVALCTINTLFRSPEALPLLLRNNNNALYVVLRHV